MRAGTRQGFRTKLDSELDLKSWSEQGPNSNLGQRQNPGFRPDLNSGCRQEKYTQATVDQTGIKPVRKQTQGTTRHQAAGVSEREGRAACSSLGQGRG